MRILFLHGWNSKPGGVKPTFLAQNGHEVFNPALPDDDFDKAVHIAQAEYDRHDPDLIVASSRGGAVAMNIHSRNTPLVLLCPAWRRWGTAKTVKLGTVVLHSKGDDLIPIADSLELLRKSGLPESALIAAGSDHRLADPESLRVMLEAVERVADFPPIHERSTLNMAVLFKRTIPLLRIFSVEKAKEFYVDFLGFTVDWEHHFDDNSPAYMQVSRDGLVLHLSEHHGDCCPGSTVFVWMTGIDEFHREISSKNYKYLRPGIETTFYEAKCVEVIDPFGNRIRFNEDVKQGK